VYQLRPIIGEYVKRYYSHFLLSQIYFIKSDNNNSNQKISSYVEYSLKLLSKTSIGLYENYQFQSNNSYVSLTIDSSYCTFLSYRHSNFMLLIIIRTQKSSFNGLKFSTLQHEGH